MKFKNKLTVKPRIKKCRLGSPDGLYVEFPDY